nr:unnamed protein product [Callosobruchus analis]
MSATDFDHLLELISTKLRKKDTRMRKPITPGERLAVTLRYLATGDSYKSLMYLFRIPQTTIARIIPECCDAIYDCLQAKYLKVGTQKLITRLVMHIYSKK